MINSKTLTRTNQALQNRVPVILFGDNGDIGLAIEWALQIKEDFLNKNGRHWDDQTEISTTVELVIIRIKQ